MSSRLKLAISEDSKLVRLYHGKLEHDLISAGPMQLNRLCDFGDDQLAFASGESLYKVKYNLAETKFERGRQGPCISRPVKLEIASCDKLSSSHKYEVQCLDICRSTNSADSCLASIDLMGGLQVKRLNSSASQLTEPEAKRRKVNLAQTLPDSSQPGYCGCHWSTNDEIVLFSHWQRKIQWWDVEKQVATKQVRTWLKPNDCSIMTKSGSPIIGVAERNVLSVWDARVKSKEGMIARVRVGPNPYWSVCVLNDTLFAIAGTDKVVSVIDSRKWSAVAGWRSGAKLELLKVCASPTKPKLVYGAGRDNDLVCGEWHTKRKATAQGFGQGLHVDAPWAGLTIARDRAPGSGECMIGVTQKGSLYVAKDPFHLHLVKKTE